MALKARECRKTKYSTKKEGYNALQKVWTKLIAGDQQSSGGNNIYELLPEPVMDENGIALADIGGIDDVKNWEIKGHRNASSGKIQGMLQFKLENPKLKNEHNADYIPNGIWQLAPVVFIDIPCKVYEYAKQNKQIAPVIYRELLKEEYRKNFKSDFENNEKFDEPLMKLKHLADDYIAKNPIPSGLPIMIGAPALVVPSPTSPPIDDNIVTVANQDEPEKNVVSYN